MKTCDEILDLISARLDGALSPTEEAALAEHLASCPACAALAADLETIHAVLPGLNEEPPPFMMKHVMAQIKAETPAPIPFPAAPQARNRWRKWGATAAVLVLLTAGGIYLNSLNSGVGRATPLMNAASGGAQSYAEQDAVAPLENPPTPEAMLAPTPQVRNDEDGSTEADVTGGSGVSADDAITAPSVNATVVPRIAATGVRGTAIPTPADACRRLYDERFATDYPDAEITDTGVLLGEQELTCLGWGTDEMYYLFSLTGQDDTADTFAVPLDDSLPILSQREDKESFPDY